MSDDMLIPDGLTCEDCANFRKCFMIFGADARDTSCDWSPHRFVKAARSDSEDTHPVTGNPIHKATYKAVKDFIDENRVTDFRDLVNGMNCEPGVMTGLMDELCEIVGYYEESE